MRIRQLYTYTVTELLRYAASLSQSLTAGGRATPLKADLTHYAKSSDHKREYFKKTGHGSLDTVTQFSPLSLDR